MPSFITNKELCAAILECQQSNEHPNQVSDKLAKLLMKFVDNYGNKHNFRNYSYLEEMKCAALMHLVSPGAKTGVPPILLFNFQYAIGKAAAESIRLGRTINPAQNPFAYLTSIVHNVFLRILKLEKRQHDIRDDLIVMCGQMPSYGRQQENHDAQEWSSDPIVKPEPKPATKRRPGRPKRAA